MPEPKPKPIRANWRRCIVRLTLISVFLAVGTIAVLLFNHGRRLASPERRLIQDYHLDYFENAKTHGIQIEKLDCLAGKAPTLVVAPDASASLGERGTLVRQQISDLGQPLAQNGQIKATLVLLHGRNGRKEDMLPIAERFCAVGFRCILPDLPAHGESPIGTSHFGLSDWERRMPAAVLEECARHYNFNMRPSALWGISMGGSFATAAASIGGPWDCLVIVSSFDELDNVVTEQCKSNTLAAAVSFISQHHGGPDITKVSPRLWAQSSTQPVFIAHGTEDKLIDLETGHALFDSFPSADKRWVEVDGGSHHTILTTPMPLFSMMADWLLRHITTQPVAPIPTSPSP